jgi:hypothetical protein
MPVQYKKRHDKRRRTIREKEVKQQLGPEKEIMGVNMNKIHYIHA